MINPGAEFNNLLRTLMRDNYVTDSRIKWLLRNESVSSSEIDILRHNFFKQSARVAVKRIKAYSGINSTSLEDWPILSKTQLLENSELYYPELGLRRYLTPVGKTSGTTGTPLMFYRSLDSVVWENAFVYRHWHWSGYKRGMPRATLRGNLVVAADDTKGPFWTFNRWENQLILSSRHLRPPFIDEIVGQLARFKPYILQAYPSTAYELANYLSRKGRTLAIPYVYTGSEMLYPHQRSLICEVFKTRVMDFYGMAERVAFATECEHGNYHVNPEYSWVEIVDDNGFPTHEEGYVVGTTFHNLTMPLIRYRLTDRTRWKPGNCPCGRVYPMIEPITGKYEDVVYGSAGNAISPSIITFAFKGLHSIARSQVAQVSPNIWEVRIVPLSGFGFQESSMLVDNIHRLVDPDLDVRIVECEDIPRTSAGKYRWIVNECLIKQRELLFRQ